MKLGMHCCCSFCHIDVEQNPNNLEDMTTLNSQQNENRFEETKDLYPNLTKGMIRECSKDIQDFASETLDVHPSETLDIYLSVS